MNEFDEIVDKHFAQAEDQTIKPEKALVSALPQGKEIKRVLENYFATTKATYNYTFQNGKILARMKEYKSPVDVLPVITELIIQGIKNANGRAGVSNETLTNYFEILKTATTILENNVKILLAKRGSADQAQPFDMMELLAIFCGFLAEKLHD